MSSVYNDISKDAFELAGSFRTSGRSTLGSDFHSIPLNVVGAMLDNEDLSILFGSLASYQESGNVAFVLQAIEAWSKYLGVSTARLFLNYGKYIQDYPEDATRYSSSLCIDAVVYDILTAIQHKDKDEELTTRKSFDVSPEVTWFLVKLYRNHISTDFESVDLPFMRTSTNVPETISEDEDVPQIVE